MLRFLQRGQAPPRMEQAVGGYEDVGGDAIDLERAGDVSMWTLGG
jgi:hypothetical protein